MSDHPTETVTIGVTRKFNIGNFESLDVHVGRTTGLKIGETAEMAYTRVEKEVDTEMSCLVAVASQYATLVVVRPKAP